MRIGIYRHAAGQRAGLAALARLALASSRRRARGAAAAPGPWLAATVPPPGHALVRDYLLENGGDPGAWGDELPPHLFAWFGLPLALRVIAGLPLPVQRTLNAGCAWRRNQPLPAGAPLAVRARLAALEADEVRARASIEIVAGTAAAPSAVEAEMRVFVPLGRRERAAGGGATRREVPTVPADARPVARLHLPADAGAAFAALTGDFNPIHWLRPVARLAGFGGCILQGFAMHARAVEALGATLPGGARSLRAADVRFARPLVLPAEVGVYARAGALWLGAGPGEPAHLVGSFEPGPAREA